MRITRRSFLAAAPALTIASSGLPAAASAHAVPVGLPSPAELASGIHVLVSATGAGKTTLSARMIGEYAAAFPGRPVRTLGYVREYGAPSGWSVMPTSATASDYRRAIESARDAGARLIVLDNPSPVLDPEFGAGVMSAAACGCGVLVQTPHTDPFTPIFDLARWWGEVPVALSTVTALTLSGGSRTSRTVRLDKDIRRLVAQGRGADAHALWEARQASGPHPV